MTRRHEFHGWNAGHVAALYERYRRDPSSVDPASRAFFAAWSPDELDGEPAPAAVQDIVGTVSLAQSIRQYGHLDATLDPLGSAPRGDPSLKAERHSINEAGLRALSSRVIGGPVAERTATAKEGIDELRRIYSSTRGFDFEHLRDPEERGWLRHAAESSRFCPPGDPIDAKAILERLTEVEVFEQFLTYSIDGIQHLVLAVSGGGYSGEYIAFRLPASAR